MKQLLKRAKRGFTLVELSIVIAIIALLAAALIPTFANVVKNSTINAASVAAEEEIDYYLSSQLDSVAVRGDYIVTYDGYAFLVDDGKFKDTAYDLSNGKPEDYIISLTCGANEENVTITLVTDENVTSVKTDVVSEKTNIEVKNNSKDVITVNAQIAFAEESTTSYVCTIYTIKKGDGEKGSSDTYLHDKTATAIYKITYSEKSSENQE